MPKSRKKPWFRVCIVHNSKAAGLLGFDLFLRLARDFGEDYCFEHELLDTNGLHDAKEVKQANWEVRQADMVIMALAPEADFSSDVKHWMEAWPPFPNRPKRVLVGFWDFPGQGIEEVVVQEKLLRELAGAKRMDFISNLAFLAPFRAEEPV